MRPRSECAAAQRWGGDGGDGGGGNVEDAENRFFLKLTRPDEMSLSGLATSFHPGSD